MSLLMLSHTCFVGFPFLSNFSFSPVLALQPAYLPACVMFCPCTLICLYFREEYKGWACSWFEAPFFLPGIWWLGGFWCWCLHLLSLVCLFVYSSKISSALTLLPCIQYLHHILIINYWNCSKVSSLCIKYQHSFEIPAGCKKHSCLQNRVLYTSCFLGKTTSCMSPITEQRYLFNVRCI